MKWYSSNVSGRLLQGWEPQYRSVWSFKLSVWCLLVEKRTGCSTTGLPTVSISMYTYVYLSIYLSIYIYIYIYIFIYLSINIYIIIVYTYIWFAMRVHLRVFDCESLRGSNIRPAEMFSLSLQFLFLNVSRKVHYMDAQWIVKRFDYFAFRLTLYSIRSWSPAAAKLPKVRLCQSQTTRPLVPAFCLMCPLLMAGVCR